MQAGQAKEKGNTARDRLTGKYTVYVVQGKEKTNKINTAHEADKQEKYTMQAGQAKEKRNIQLYRVGQPQYIYTYIYIDMYLYTGNRGEGRIFNSP